MFLYYSKFSIVILLLFLLKGSVVGQNFNDLHFTENKGQWHSSINYVANLPVGELYILQDGLGYELIDKEKEAEIASHTHPHTDSDHDSEETNSQEINYHYYKVQFLGALGLSNHKGNKKSYSYENFLLGRDPNKWASGVHKYKEVSFENVYEGIDLFMFEDKSSLKYEFHCAPRTDFKSIKMKYDGVDEIWIDKIGALHIQTSLGEIIENPPYAYQIIKGEEVQVPCYFELDDNVLSYRIPSNSYKKRYPLVIDPRLIFSTLSGSAADNWGNTACEDDRGNFYAGSTVFLYANSEVHVNPLHTGFPTQLGSFSRIFQGGDTDIGIMKFDSTGTNLIFSTYIGGNDAEIPTSIVVNDEYDIYVLGATGSTNFPISDIEGYDTSFNGGSKIDNPVDGGYDFTNGSDIFVLKLSSDGTTLKGFTYLGGSDNDGVLNKNLTVTNNYGDVLRGDIVLGKNSEVFITGTTYSDDYPTLTTIQPNFGGGAVDAVVSKLSADLSVLEWSTYLGGTLSDAGMSVRTDSSDNIYVGGITQSRNFVTTTGVIEPNYIGGIADGFITHISPQGDSIISSTYLGTNSFDGVYFVQLDDAQNIYIYGQTKGLYPITEDTYHVPRTGMVVHKLTPGLDSTYFSTVFGSPNRSGAIIPNISPTAFLVNECENLFFSGWGGNVNTASRGYNGGFTHNMPITDNAFQKTTNGSDFYFMVLSKDAKELIYGTYFGGRNAAEHVDGGTSRFDKRGIIYQAVCANCGNFTNQFPRYPLNSDGEYPKDNASNNCNMGMVKFDLANLVADFTTETNCISGDVIFTNTSTGGADFEWDFGDGNKFYTPLPSTISHTYENDGRYTVTLIATDITTCVGRDTIQKEIIIVPALYNTKYEDSLCYGDQKEIDLYLDKEIVSILWTPSEGLSDTNIRNPRLTAIRDIEYIIEIMDKDSCVYHDTLTVNVLQLNEEIQYKMLGSCDKTPEITFYTTDHPTREYTWNLGDGNRREGSIFNYRYNVQGNYLVTLTAKQNGKCEHTDTITVRIPEILIPNIFTPNNDNVNDFYEIKGIEGTGEWKLEVYNRWGKIIFENENYKNEWGGTSMTGEELDNGTYFFMITSPDERTCKGWVQIER